MQAEYIQHVGTDLTVVNAARVSFDKESDWERDDYQKIYDLPGSLSERDGKLIHYLARHGHFTPFTHCFVTLRETVPIFVARQRFKHMVGFSYNEVSRRYVSDTPKIYKPLEWRRASENKKQGSSDEVFEGSTAKWIEERYSTLMDDAIGLYESLISTGVAPEQARMVLPQSSYTSYYVSGSLAAWSRAYQLRSDSHAQKEIQDLAQLWYNIISPLFPVSWEALTGNNHA
jgi:thymidylate synthase (FAD)